MNRLSIATAAFALLTAPAFADGHASGDAAAGDDDTGNDGHGKDSGRDQDFI